MVWKYLVIGCLLAGFVFYYQQISEILKLPFSHQAIVLVCSLVLMFVVSPLFWRAIHKQNQHEKENNKTAKQPWE